MESQITRDVKKKVRRSFALAIVAFLGFEIIFGWIHEAGHGIACMAFGLDPEVNLVIFGTSRAWCDAQTDIQFLIIGMSGGILGGIASGALAFVSRTKYVWMFVAAASTAVGHAVRAVLESLFHSFYLTQQTVAGQVIGITVTIAFILFTKYYLMDKAKKEINAMQTGDEV